MDVLIERPADSVLADQDDVVVEPADKDGVVGGFGEPALLLGADGRSDKAGEDEAAAEVRGGTRLVATVAVA